jgi:SAM-dependent methyltransferase
MPLCPICRATLDPSAWNCAQGHAFDEVGGVRRLLAPDLAQRLVALEAAFRAAGRGAGRAEDYAKLPFGPLAEAGPGLRLEWRLRRYDLEVVRRLMAGRSGQRVLDVGAWNGWLSHRLAEAGHAVTAVDYFADADNGLGARRFYPTRWRAIQMDLRDLSLLDEQFDVVILNRCLAFFTDPAAYVEAARARVAAGGLLLATGLQIFDAPEAKARQVADERRRFQARHAQELFLFPTRGYLDGADEARLRTAGLRLHPYGQLWAANLKARVFRSRPRYCNGVWANGGGL